MAKNFKAMHNQVVDWMGELDLNGQKGLAEPQKLSSARSPGLPASYSFGTGQFFVFSHRVLKAFPRRCLLIPN